MIQRVIVSVDNFTRDLSRSRQTGYCSNWTQLRDLDPGLALADDSYVDVSPQVRLEVQSFQSNIVVFPFYPHL